MPLVRVKRRIKKVLGLRHERRGEALCRSLFGMRLLQEVHLSELRLSMNTRERLEIRM